MNQPTITILSFSPLQGDGRVLRQIEYLSRHFQVAVYAYGHLPPGLADNIAMTPIHPPTSAARRGRKVLLLPLGRVSSAAYNAWYWNEEEYQTAYQLLLNHPTQAIHANDWESLPVAVEAAKQTGAKVVLDLHEYAPLLRENRLYWRLFYKPVIEYFLRKYVGKVDASVTVNKTISDRYRQTYNLNPITVMNAPKLANAPAFKPTNPKEIRLIHHGNALKDRKMELMIETIAQTEPRYSLHFMLVDRSPGYIEKLELLAQRLAPGRVCFYPPVAPNEIVSRIAEFDMGFYLLPANSYNQLVASPNKFFDFIMAGLAVCIGPSPEMARLTQQFDFGRVVPSLNPAEAARQLNRLTAADIDQMKQNALFARQRINADIELGKLVNLYTTLLGKPDLL